MPQLKMTDAAVQRVTVAPGVRVDFFDAHPRDRQRGLVLRVSAAPGRGEDGAERVKVSRSWAVLYRVAGSPKLRRLTLGEYPSTTLAEARQQAEAAVRSARRGVDPAEARKPAAPPPAPRTVDDLIEEYLKRHARPHKRSAAEDERMLKRELLGLDAKGAPIDRIDPAVAWRGKAVETIGRRDIVELLDRIVDRGSPIQANRTLAGVRRMFNFAVERGLLDASPCVKIKPPGKERARERCLSNEEIIAVWSALDRSAMERNIRHILRLMLATGQRKGEIVGLREAEMNDAARRTIAALRADEPVREEDQREAAWTIPSERAKNGREHVVPLAPLALEIIAAATPRNGWGFPAIRTGAPYLERSLSHAVADLYRRRAGAKAEAPLVLDGMAPWTPHDLRRTAATGMRSLGVTRDDLKLVLNHSDRSVTGVYDRYEGLREKRSALETWARALTSLLRPAPGNVVELSAAR